MFQRRLTFVARDIRKPDMDWNYAPHTGEAVAFIESAAALQAALCSGAELNLDIARAVIDRAGTSDEFLDLLTRLPAEFTGDALYVRDDFTGVLSATGRGGDRVLYSLSSYDVRFYLETLDLVTGRMVMERTA